MTRDETKNIIRFISDCYPTFRPNNISEMIDTWTLMLGDYSYLDIQKALKAYVLSETKGFAPSPGQLIDNLVMLKHENEMSALEAWSLVEDAVSNSIYHSEEEFAKLPHVAQRAIGNHHVLKEWATMETSTVQSVEQSHFIRAYNTELQREIQNNKLPQNMRRPAIQVKTAEVLEEKKEDPECADPEYVKGLMKGFMDESGEDIPDDRPPW